MAVELVDWLLLHGVKVGVLDPCVIEMPERWGSMVTRFTNSLESMEYANALIIGTDWPIFKEYAAQLKASILKGKIIIDPNAWIKKEILDKGAKYYAVGTSS